MNLFVSRMMLGLALAILLLAAPQAQAFTCISDVVVPNLEGPFTDCSGTTNYAYSGLGQFEHVTAFDGPFKQDGWFTDLHITLLDTGVSFSGTGVFNNNTDNVAWDVEFAGNTISFIAPNNAARVDGDASGVAGDSYDWGFGVLGASSLNEISLRIEYTMDVPEPGSLALVSGALLALMFGARRRRQA